MKIVITINIIDISYIYKLQYQFSDFSASTWTFTEKKSACLALMKAGPWRPEQLSRRKGRPNHVEIPWKFNSEKPLKNDLVGGWTNPTEKY